MNHLSLNQERVRSSVPLYDKDACIICQKEEGTMHKVSFKATGEKMLEVAEKLTDRSFFLRLNSIPNASDAIANGMQYHLNCWVQYKISKISTVLADIEIVDLGQNSLEESPHTVLDMKTVNITYNNLLGIPPDRTENFKRYLKQLLKENVSQIVFTRPPARNEPERLCSLQAHSSAIEKTFKNSWENYTNIFEAAKMIRKNLIKQEKWQFFGSFLTVFIFHNLSSQCYNGF